MKILAYQEVSKAERGVSDIIYGVENALKCKTSITGKSNGLKKRRRLQMISDKTAVFLGDSITKG